MSAIGLAWFATLDPIVRTRGRGTSSPCRAHRTGGRVFEACTWARPAAPSATSELQELERRGVWELPGSAAALEARCTDHVCFQPGWMVVELWSAEGYRTCGYPLHASLSAQDSGARLLAAF